MNLKADTRRYMQKGKEHTTFPFLLNRLIYSIVNKEFILFYHYTNENNPDDSSRQAYFCNSGSTCYGMVEINGACGCAAKLASRARTAKAAPCLFVSLLCFYQQKWQVRLYLPFLLVDRNHTNSNPTFRFSEKWFCATLYLPEKL